MRELTDQVVVGKMLPIGQVTQHDTLVSDSTLAAGNSDRNPLYCLITCLDIVQLYLWATCEEQEWEFVCLCTMHAAFHKIASVLACCMLTVQQSPFFLFFSFFFFRAETWWNCFCKLTWISEVCDLNRASYLLPTPTWCRACARLGVTHLISSQDIPYIVQCWGIIGMNTASGFESLVVISWKQLK